jgi:hypothetical protein
MTTRNIVVIRTVEGKAGHFGFPQLFRKAEIVRKDPAFRPFRNPPRKKTNRRHTRMREEVSSPKFLHNNSICAMLYLYVVNYGFPRALKLAALRCKLGPPQ